MLPTLCCGVLCGQILTIARSCDGGQGPLGRGLLLGRRGVGPDSGS